MVVAGWQSVFLYCFPAHFLCQPLSLNWGLISLIMQLAIEPQTSSYLCLCRFWGHRHPPVHAYAGVGDTDILLSPVCACAVVCLGYRHMLSWSALFFTCMLEIWCLHERHLSNYTVSLEPVQKHYDLIRPQILNSAPALLNLHTFRILSSMWRIWPIWSCLVWETRIWCHSSIHGIRQTDCLFSICWHLCQKSGVYGCMGLYFTSKLKLWIHSELSMTCAFRQVFLSLSFLRTLLYLWSGLTNL